MQKAKMIWRYEEKPIICYQYYISPYNKVYSIYRGYDRFRLIIHFDFDCNYNKKELYENGLLVPLSRVAEKSDQEFECVDGFPGSEIKSFEQAEEYLNRIGPNGHL
jgi:hypothetical protein